MCVCVSRQPSDADINVDERASIPVYVCVCVCPLYYPSSLEIVQQPLKAVYDVNERGYKHVCGSVCVCVYTCVCLCLCVQSINPVFRDPPPPTHLGGFFIAPPHFSLCNDLPLPWQQTLPRLSG